MSDGHDSSYEAGVDREINVRSIVYTGLGLAFIIVLAAALMWWMSAGLLSRLAASDPAPPVLPEARTQELPPQPRLQTRPEGELRDLRAEEDAILNGYGWTSEAAGVARIPIARAMEIRAAEPVGPQRIELSEEEPGS